MDGIPSEIVAKIFVLCLPETNYIRPHPSTAPILLTHVCSSWRAFAFDLPNLWTSIHLTDAWKGDALPVLFDEVSSVNQRLLHQAELWNRHSRGRLSSISLNLAYQHYTQSFISFWHPLVHRVVIENLQTVRHLFIRFNFDYHGLPFYLPDLEIRNLESLHFVVAENELDHLFPCPTIFSQAPSLRRVILDVPRTGKSRDMQLPWPQLTHLVLIFETSLSFFYSILQGCLSLERLSINIYNSSNAPVSTALIKITKLRDLSFTLLHVENPSFIDTVAFPVLENFQFFSSNRISPPQFSWDPLTPSHWQMLHQLRNLHTLVLGFHEMSGDTLLEVLRLIPHLVELAVDADLGTYRSFLQGLTYESNPEGDHQNIVKNLETFRLYMELTGDGRLQPRISDDFSVILDALLVMVLSRSHSISSPRGEIEENHTAFSEESTAPAHLRNVLLRVDKEELQESLDEFHTRCQTYPQLSPPNMLFEIICKVDEFNWLVEKVDTWETST
ncbi:hypothetical protein M413DRAFT_23051 [Hebeloma cylindrosporum]|uniref:Uncharacterized protein n=1 Tax=Hebeloma cylindrosporum TaxID=76867 RepID=A0A0C3CS32_HEBCY|nr:hypothetical protein M413DRAFT_23051 [Hebeloma cylindrosporum h7]